MGKERIDVMLVEQGFFESREKAKAAIMAGIVFHGTERLEKPGTKIDQNLELTVKGHVHPYVSRGGLKLEKAIRHFELDLTNKVMLDIGASTGGFTDCALQNGAAHVYAIDVGYNQLDYKIRQDERVIVMERTNFRFVEPKDLQGPIPNFASIDVSFISLRLILPVLKSLLAHDGHIVALIKPQFEAGREEIGKSGVIRDSKVHQRVLMDMLIFGDELGLILKGLTYSPIRGGEGNIEFLAHWSMPNAELEQRNAMSFEQLVNDIVKEAHQSTSK